MNGNAADPKKLREFMDKERLNWRSFADKGAIQTQWNAATPAYYIIDAKGVIRYKWAGNPGARAIDAALEKLISEAEAGSVEGK